MLKVISKYYRPGTSQDDFEKLCSDAVGDDDEAVLHEADNDDDNDDCEETGSDISDVASLLGSLMGSNTNSDVDPNELRDVSDVDEDKNIEDDKTESLTLVKSDNVDRKNDSSEAESSFSEHLTKLDDEFGQMNINPILKSQYYKELAMSDMAVSKETDVAVKRALSKHTNPVSCDICGELMKNLKTNETNLNIYLPFVFHRLHAICCNDLLNLLLLNSPSDSKDI